MNTYGQAQFDLPYIALESLDENAIYWRDYNGDEEFFDLETANQYEIDTLTEQVKNLIARAQVALNALEAHVVTGRWKCEGTWEFAHDQSVVQRRLAEPHITEPLTPRERVYFLPPGVSPDAVSKEQLYHTRMTYGVCSSCVAAIAASYGGEILRQVMKDDEHS